MKERKTPVIISGFWQFIRFVVLVVSAILYLNPRLTAGASVLIAMLAAPSLVLATASFIGGTNNEKFTQLRDFILFGKLLEVLPGFTLLLLQGAAMYFGLASPVFDVVFLLDELSGYTLETERLFYYLLASIVLLDLIFLLVLLSYRREPDNGEPGGTTSSGDNLPEYRTDEIDEGE